MWFMWTDWIGQWTQRRMFEGMSILQRKRQHDYFVFSYYNILVAQQFILQVTYACMGH